MAALRNISVEEALRCIEELQMAEWTDEIVVSECAGQVAAEDLFAQNDQPPFDRSALDGFALRSVDVKGASREMPARLRQAGDLPAGCAAEVTVREGECVRIMTGGRIPAGCDAVVGIEDTAEAEEGPDGEVLIFREVQRHGNYIFRGEDFRAGQLLCPKGRSIDAAMAASLAAGGLATAACRRRAVAILATGSELAAPGSPLDAAKIYDANSVYLQSRLKQMHFRTESLLLTDDKALIAAKLSEAAEHYPLVITTGGVSVGDADHMPDVLELCGAQILFRGVRLKPGSPLMLARLKNSIVLCLSGNPYACAATFELFARPLLSKRCAEDLRMGRAKGRLFADFPKAGGVPRYVRAQLRDGVVHFPSQHSSGQLYSLSGCDCFARIEAGSAPAAGTEVSVYLME